MGAGACMYGPGMTCMEDRAPGHEETKRADAKASALFVTGNLQGLFFHADLAASCAQIRWLAVISLSQCSRGAVGSICS